MLDSRQSFLTLTLPYEEKLAKEPGIQVGATGITVILALYFNPNSQLDITSI